MLPKPPPRDHQLGFLYIPPYRIIGTSIAGEATAIHVPELDLGFDIGVCPRPMLASRFVAVSHGHMDHIGGLAYFFSQRHFQGMGTGTVVCDAKMVPAIQKMMAGYVDLERQNTPFELVGLEPEQTVEIKNNIHLRAFSVEHTVPTLGYVVVEKRSKLRPDLIGLPQEKLMELKDRGEQITRILEIPLIAYVMDTGPGPHLVREDVRKSQILITECTFFEGDHKDRAKIGMHLHVDDLAEWMRVVECQRVVLGHISRRTNLLFARQELAKKIPREKLEKIEILMDHRYNKARYERQQIDAGEHPDQLAGRAGGRGPRRFAGAAGPGGGGGGGGGGGVGGSGVGGGMSAGGPRRFSASRGGGVGGGPGGDGPGGASGAGGGAGGGGASGPGGTSGATSRPFRPRP